MKKYPKPISSFPNKGCMTHTYRNEQPPPVGDVVSIDGTDCLVMGVDDSDSRECFKADGTRAITVNLEEIPNNL